MKFIIGIGNPGKKYQGTRHNTGFRALDRLEGKIGGDAMLIRPDTFVNNTGEAVSALVKKYDPKAADILVVCDDVNLDFGKLRLRASGSAGGHHGLESVIAALGSEGFARLRIGVRNERMPEDLTGFVLGKFSNEEEKEVGGI